MSALPTGSWFEGGLPTRAFHHWANDSGNVIGQLSRDVGAIGDADPEPGAVLAEVILTGLSVAALLAILADQGDRITALEGLRDDAVADIDALKLPDTRVNLADDGIEGGAGTFHPHNYGRFDYVYSWHNPSAGGYWYIPWRAAPDTFYGTAENRLYMGSGVTTDDDDQLVNMWAMPQ